MRGLRILGLGGKSSPTDKKKGTATRNSRYKNSTSCPSGTCGSGTNVKPRREVVTKGKQPPMKEVSKPSPKDTTKSESGKLYMTASGGGGGTPAFNVGESVGKITKAPTNGTDTSNVKTPNTASSSQSNKGKGASTGGLKFEIGVKKGNVEVPVVKFNKKPKGK